MRHKKHNGYILILTLLIIAGITAVVTYIFNRSIVHVPYASLVVTREKAKLLALGGLEVACAQLTYVPVQEKNEAPSKAAGAQKKIEPPALVAARALLTTVLPALNRWQIFKLTHAADGIDAELKLCMMSEEGKINLNAIFDFEKGVYKGEQAAMGNWKLIMQELCKKIDAVAKTSDSFSALTSFLKKRDGKKLEDVTELLTIPAFNQFKYAVYYEPPMDKANTRIYLTDIFTTYSNRATLEPWLFSDSLLALLDIKRASGSDVVVRQEQIQDWMKKVTTNTLWQLQWASVLKPIYEKDLPSLPKGLDSVLATIFDPQLFSVRIEATVDGVTQQLFAIIKRKSRSHNNEIVYYGKVKKVYWL